MNEANKMLRAVSPHPSKVHFTVYILNISLTSLEEQRLRFMRFDLFHLKLRPRPLIISAPKV